MTFYGGLSAEHLKQFVERIERLESERKTISDDIKEVYNEAKSNGFDNKTLREVIRLRKMEDNERDELEHLLDTYKSALGMTPSADE